MLSKIRFRLVYNYGGKLNKNGSAPVALECRQGSRKIHLSSNILIQPCQWDRGKVICHDNAAKLTAYLVRWMHQIEEIELNSLLNGHQMTLQQLRTAVKEGIHTSASLREFMEAVIQNDSSRCATTKRGYCYLVNDMESEFGTLTVADVTYDLIVRYRESMRRKGLSENTIKGRLKALRCLLEQARLRDIIDRNPFEAIVIGNITARAGGLSVAEVQRIERLQLTGKEDRVRDFFLLACYSGLRFGDLSTLEDAEIKNGILRKVMHKTHREVIIPIGTLFHGRAQEIINKYQDITELSHCGCNTQVNRILKDIAAKAGIKKRVYMHLGRKTFSGMLNTLGLPLADISVLMGHTSSEITHQHYIFNDIERISKAIKKIFK